MGSPVNLIPKKILIFRCLRLTWLCFYFWKLHKQKTSRSIFFLHSNILKSCFVSDQATKIFQFYGGNTVELRLCMPLSARAIIYVSVTLVSYYIRIFFLVCLFVSVFKLLCKDKMTCRRIRTSKIKMFAFILMCITWHQRYRHSKSHLLFIWREWTTAHGQSVAIWREPPRPLSIFEYRYTTVWHAGREKEHAHWLSEVQG